MWLWVVGGGLLVIGLAIGALVFALGSTSLLDESYKADLTRGLGDFPAKTTGNMTTRYAADGFHVRLAAGGGWGMVANKSPSAHTNLGVEVVAVPLEARPDAGFGPWCLQDGNHGYGLAVYSSGDVALVESLNGVQSTIATGTTAAWSLGQQKRLWLTCTFGNDIQLTAYVDGTKVAEATATSIMSEVNLAGFAGYTPTNTGPAEWGVSLFWRHPPGSAPVPR